MPATMKKVRNTSRDPHDIERRLENLIHVHLLDMEENPEMFASKERLATIAAIGMFLNRKYGWGEDENAGAGSAVRRYAGAFKTPPHVRPMRVSGGTHTDDGEEDAA